MLCHVSCGCTLYCTLSYLTLAFNLKGQPTTMVLTMLLMWNFDVAGLSVEGVQPQVPKLLSSRGKKCSLSRLASDGPLMSLSLKLVRGIGARI